MKAREAISPDGPTAPVGLAVNSGAAQDPRKGWEAEANPSSGLILANAEASAAERPQRTTLDRREIERIADFFYAHELAADEEKRHV